MKITDIQIQNKFVLKLSLCSVFVALVLFFVGVFAVKTETSMLFGIDKPEVWSSGWSYAENKKSIDEDYVTIFSDEETTICHDLPGYFTSDKYIALWNFYTLYEVYIDGDLLQKGGSETDIRFGKEQGGLWYIIHIPEGYHRSIEVKLQSTWGDKRYPLNRFLFGSKSQILSLIESSNIVCFIICLFLVGIQILLLLYYGIMMKYKLTCYTKLLMGLCGLTFVSLIYILSESNILQFCFTRPSIRYLGSYFAVFFIPVFGCMFFGEFFLSGKEFFKNLLFFYCIALLLCLVLYATNIVHVRTSVGLVYLVVAIITFEIVSCGIREFKETRDFLNIQAIIAVLVLIFGTIASIFLYYSGLTTDNILPYSITYAIFIAVLFSAVMRRTFAEFSVASSAEYYRELAYTDDVTGGKTRVYFDELLKIDHSCNYFIMINLIQFKLINQIVGHKKGDKLLKRIYSEIQDLIKDNEFMCYLGNARFGVCKKIDSKKDLVSFCKNVKQNIEYYLDTHNYSVKIGLNFAAYEKDENYYSLEKLLDFAVMALISSKAEYISDVKCFIYNEECNSYLLKEKMYSDYLDIALAEDQFYVYLQPKISLKDGKIHSAEALVRWFNPEKGMIPPDEFIPSFEKNGKIEKLDLFLFKKVCLQVKNWLDNGIDPVTISVNISKVAINEEGYFQRYMDIIKEINIPGKYIEFELTESIAYNNIEILRNIIKQIHDIGSSCSMDDFGKSYSNIGALGALQFDIAKMDKCFFDDGFPQEEKQVQLVQGTVSLLKNLNLSVIAEGIEDKEQVDALKSIGCDEIQGFYFAKPMDIKAFMDFVAKINKN